jgi:hypothetical protein
MEPVLQNLLLPSFVVVPSTSSFRVEDELEVKPVPPLYAALMEYNPCVNVVAHVATPTLTATVPQPAMVVPLLVKFTVPTFTVLVEDTSAVNVTAPEFAGLLEGEIVVVVLADAVAL